MNKKQEIVRSSEVIEYLKERINPKYYETLFTAGSLPEKLVPQSDLDIFVSVKHEYKNEFFNQLTTVMDSYIAEHKEVKYSLYRGPLKYKHKGLVHFLCFTDEICQDLENRRPFRNENRRVLKTLLNNYSLIGGDPLEKVLDGVNIYEEERNEYELNKFKTKLEILKEKGYNAHRSWKQKNGEWNFYRERKYASQFLKEYLIRYYEKHTKEL
ncbi:MAG: hypothetical protein ACP5N3_00140 [Candidatus Nanoarchaeia archaeon]